MFYNASARFLFAGRHALRNTPLVLVPVEQSLSLRFSAPTFSRPFSISKITLGRTTPRCDSRVGAFSPLLYTSPIISAVTRPLSWQGSKGLSGTHFETVRSMRHLYSRARRKSLIGPLKSRRWLTESLSTRKEPQASKAATDKSVSSAETTTEHTQKPPHEKHLLDRLPEISNRFHRPTKEELLAAATGFWQRLRIRFKWLTIRSSRPFNSDDISAFFSWIIVGHVIWILVGTTTFFSLLILAVNTVFAQGWSVYQEDRIHSNTRSRNTCKMGWQLSNKVLWCKSYIRVCYCA